MNEVTSFLNKLPSDHAQNPLVAQAVDYLHGLDIDSKLEAIDEATRRGERKPYLHAVVKSKLKERSYAEVLDEIGQLPKELGSLYLHIPFCTKRCNYCHYYKETGVEDAVMDRFPKLLFDELTRIEKLSGVARFEPRSIHFGGGTPSLLTIEQWTDVITRLRQHVDVDATEEVAIECSPEDVTDDKLAFWKEHGVNRLSLGVQSFSQPVLEILQRLHSVEQGRDAIVRAQKHDYRNINVDLMHAMPAHTLDSWLEDVEAMLELQPPSITIYATRANPSDVIPTGRVSFPGAGPRMLGHAVAHVAFTNAGYFQYSPNQYIKSYDGRCLAKGERNRCSNILGVGPSAHSIFHGWFFHNRGNLNKYIETIEEGGLCKLMIGRLSEMEERVRYLQFGVKLSGNGKPMDDNGALRSGYRDRFGDDFEHEFSEKLTFLQEQGLIELNDMGARLVNGGLFMAREIVQFLAKGDVQQLAAE